MHRPTLPIQSLPAWAILNGISFHKIKVVDTEGKGYGVISDEDLKVTNDTTDPLALLTVPHDLVLNAAAVEEYAKEDKNFRLLLDAIGHRTTRADVLLFLLVQTVLASRPSHAEVGLSNPWTEYLKFLPETVPVPTLWTEDERLLLRGTSLEAALDAKMSTLDTEFDLVRQKSSDIIAWNDLLWIEGVPVSFTDWIRLDALYRSRCLELPRSGESMVPCIDMINHSATPSAYYDENAKDEVILAPRPGVSISKSEEITINYGENKSAAEMLFSYGFIDPDSSADRLVLPLTPFPDDPLAKAKLAAFREAPKIHVARRPGGGDESGTSTEKNGPVGWTSPFAYLMCVNEEDGLEFRVLQQTDGAQQLCVFWQDEDVTDRTRDFETLVRTHPLAAVLRLRVVTVVQGALQAQLERLSTAPDEGGAAPQGQQREDCVKAAMLLRGIETNILEGAVEALEEEKTALLADENVVAYLGLTEAAGSGLAGDEASNEPDDFS